MKRGGGGSIGFELLRLQIKNKVEKKEKRRRNNKKLKAIFNLILELDIHLIGIKRGHFPLKINNFLVRSDQNNNTNTYTHTHSAYTTSAAFNLLM